MSRSHPKLSPKERIRYAVCQPFIILIINYLPKVSCWSGSIFFETIVAILQPETIM